MKKLHRPIAWLAALIVLAGSVPYFRADAKLASVQISSVTSSTLAYGAAQAKTYVGKYDGKTATMQSIEFTPDADLTPTLVNHGTNIQRYTLTEQLNHYDGKLKSGQVVGGVNGGFYNSYGNAEGIQIQNGKLLSTNSFDKDNGSLGWKFYSLGFQADGRAVYDIPHFDIVAQSGSTRASVNALNQSPSAAYGLWLLTSEYGGYARWETAYPQNNYFVLVLKKTAGSLKVDGTLTGEFYEYRRYTTAEYAKCTLESGYLYLVGMEAQVKPLADASRKQAVTITLRETTGKWKTVQNALRGGNLLIQNGKAVTTGLDASIRGSYTARTIVATKADGSVGFFVVDNRSNQGDQYLYGLPLVNAAQTLVDLGYTTAVNLDGGGSSTIAARKTPSGSLQVTNRPSDGSQRSIGSALALVSLIEPDTLLNNFEKQNFTLVAAGGAAGRASLLKSRKAEYSGIACGQISYDFSKGTKDALFLDLPDKTLPANADSLSVRANALSSGITAYAVYKTAKGAQIYSANVRMTGDGYKQLYFGIPDDAVKFVGLGFTLGSGKKAGTVYLDNLLLHYSAYTKDTTAPTIQITTSLSAKAQKGTVLKMSATDDAWGAGVDTGSYEIYVNGEFKTSGRSYTMTGVPAQPVSKVVYESADKAGNRTRTFGVVTRADYNGGAYFSDVKAGFWATDYINYCYLNKLVEGDAGKYYGNRNMTRSEFCATLVRMKKVNPNAYASVKLPYADAKSIPKWAVNYVKAAYALGIMEGAQYGGTVYFSPNANITRAEVCSAIQSFLPDLAGFNGVAPFSDQASFPSWARTVIAKAAAHGVFEGDERGFRASSPITRNEIAVVLTRLY